jgi:phospho-N-acetylmuramoyl-pentapeptide-transferase
MIAPAIDIVRILLPAALSFALGMLMTPILTHYLYTYKAWKKRPGKVSLDGTKAEEFNRLHEKHEVRAPRMGGIVIWGSVALCVLILSLLATISDSARALNLDFLSRNQTWIPLAVLLIGSLVGLIDDLLVIRPEAEGLPLKIRLLCVVVLSGFIGWWFFEKLDISAINIPFYQPLEIGWLVIPFFILMSLALYASGVIDGIDGLSGGVFASIFASYTIIAFAQGQVNLAAFSAAIVGGLLAFLWYNIPPARFYMSDTGTMGLTLTIGTLAMMTDSLGGGVGVAVLPIIGLLLVVTVLSDIVQILSKKYLGKKVFRVAPLHHHFEAIGWPGPKVVMRYWVLSIICAVIGVIVALSSIG